MWNSKNRDGSVTVLQEFLNFVCYCTQFILGDVSIFKSIPLPVAGSFTGKAWIWNVAIYTADPK
jgi:hypothetical protein